MICLLDGFDVQRNGPCSLSARTLAQPPREMVGRVARSHRQRTHLSAGPVSLARKVGAHAVRAISTRALGERAEIYQQRSLGQLHFCIHMSVCDLVELWASQTSLDRFWQAGCPVEFPGSGGHSRSTSAGMEWRWRSATSCSRTGVRGQPGPKSRCQPTPSGAPPTAARNRPSAARSGSAARCGAGRGAGCRAAVRAG